MDVLAALVRGYAIGFATSLPVGPIALLCMRRTLDGGLLFGLSTGLGAAFADMLYGGIAAFGVVAISSFLAEYQVPLRLVGGLFMLVLAGRLFIAPPKVEVGRERPASDSLGALVSGFILTASNPLTMIGFAAVFASVGVASSTATSRAAGFLVMGVWLGSASWWLTVTTVVARLRHLMSDGALRLINLGAAASLAGFGAYALVSALAIAYPALF